MLHKQFKDEMKVALKNKEGVRLSVIRGLLTAFTNELVAKRRKPDEELSDDEVLTLIRRAVKQRKESIEQFEKGGRPELAAKEKEELTILESYLPSMMGKEEVEKIVAAKKSELGISDKSEAGKLIGAVMKELQGKADGTLVKAVVENSL